MKKVGVCLVYDIEPTYKISFRLRKILVPFDGSGHSISAVELALDWSRIYGSRIVALIAVPQGDKQAKIHAEKLVEKLKMTGWNRGQSQEIKVIHYDPLKESPASVIVKEANEGGYDVVILGARGNTMYEDIVLGSTTLSVLHNTNATVVVIR